MEDIQQYLDGTMSDAVRRKFEILLATDEHLRAELDVHIGMRQLRLEQCVANVSIARQLGQKIRVRRAIIIGGLIVGLIGLALFIAYNNSAFNTLDTPVHPDDAQQPVLPTPTDNYNKIPPADQSTDKKLQQSRPMAQNQSPSADKQRPQLRGVYADLDPTTQQILDSLLLLTQAQTLAASKTALWQKAVQKLVSGQVAAAKGAVLTLEKSDPAEATWLLALTLLAQGKVDAAATIFQKISRISGHPKQQLAQQALEQLKQ